MNTNNTISDVVSSGLCIGCGICAHQHPDSIEMQFQPEGMWKPVIFNQHNEFVLDRNVFCPMHTDLYDEDSLSSSKFPFTQYTPSIGHYHSLYAGSVTEGSFRANGSSGGITTWLLSQLLSTGRITGVIHVRPCPQNSGDHLFEYAVSRTVDELQSGAKSKYYPNELSRVLKLIDTQGQERYAFVGTPCFLKSIRILQEQDPRLKIVIPYLVGIVCGHMKSAFFAEYLALQKGVHPSDLVGFDFRRKICGYPASHYGFSMTYRNHGAIVNSAEFPMTSVDGKDWGEGLFRIPACEYCDDVLAECADVAVGDAWIPKYIQDELGTNILVVRSPELNTVLLEGRRSDRLAIDEISPEQVIQSQAGGIKHRNEGLAHRLSLRAKKNQLVPRKRVKPKVAPTFLRRAIYNLRETISTESISSFRENRDSGNIHAFQRGLRRLRVTYLYITLADRILSKSRHFLLHSVLGKPAKKPRKSNDQ